MVFKRMLGALGVGGPSVDTVLASPYAEPGGMLTGEVRIKGGDFEAEIEHVALGLVTRVEAEHPEGEATGTIEFFRAEVSGPFRLGTGEERAIPFQIPVPWETPITEVLGRPLHGMALGVRTELAIAKAVDKGDLDPVSVRPTPSQERVLQAFDRLGFQFRSADLEMGRIHGVYQELPFFQEIEFYPPPQYAGQVNEVELTFVTAADGLEVILEADKRGGMFSGGSDSFGRFHVSHQDALAMDWSAHINDWIAGLAQYRVPSHGHNDDYYGGYHDNDHHHHGGGGMGAAVAAGAAGVAAGFVAAEVVDEIGDFFEGEEEE
ncbi:sporulation protein [Thermocatellispora tengchongensis]|uniref:sporulation protein n=1 Tax=Thermocatellispora tengchongensis TaxID=1073253 RepID=UPI00160C2B33